jgi:hypothetical protein
MLGEAKSSGNWSFDHWQLSQSGAITHLDEASANIARVQTPAVDTAGSA